jgi:hypothetical protein
MPLSVKLASKIYFSIGSLLSSPAGKVYYEAAITRKSA